MESPDALPPPPPEIPLNFVPMKVKPVAESFVMKEIMKQKGTKGKRVSLLANHFKVTITSAVQDFYHYDVSISYEDGSAITRKNIRYAVIEKLEETYKSGLAGKQLVYDGAKSLFTSGPLPRNILEFSVILNDFSVKGNGSMDGSDQKRQKLESRSQFFKVQMSFTSQISMQSLNDAVCGKSLKGDESLRVLDTILQQRASKRGCLVVRQSFFANEQKSFVDLGGGLLGCRGFFSSFRVLQGGLYLNHGVSMTMIIQAGPLVDFLMINQNVKTPFQIDWYKAKQTMEKLRIRVKHLNSEFKISGLSEKSCKEQKFSLKLGEVGDQSGNIRTVETTVYDYFVRTRGISLSFSADLPCINAGKPRRPIFFPVELCSMVPLQRYTNDLTVYQKSAMITKSSLKPEDMIKLLVDDVKSNKYEAEPLLQSCGISINNSLVQAEGRVLSAPRLKLGNGENIIPRNGWWNIKDKKVVEPEKLEQWVVVNFSTHQDMHSICLMLAKIGSTIGMVINPPLSLFEENPKYKKKPPSVRVEMMFELMQSKFKKDPPHFILCFLADKKPSDLYGPWKRKTIIEFGIRNQCLSSSKIDELYLMNVLLKINAKLGGLNHMLASESTRTIPLVSKIPTIIFGMDVSHASLSRTDAASIASVVGSREWPKISSYKASLRAIPPKAQVIDSLFKPISQHEDAGIIRELLLDFYASSGQRKPAQFIIFSLFYLRNGLSSSEYRQVLNAEIDQILKACKFLDENWRPKFTVIVAQRRHHTKFFDANTGSNILPGTIVDNKVCDHQSTNFYMCAHSARIGTARPIHYKVLLDEIGFSSDDLQELIHSLSYVFQRRNAAISEVAPIRYARLAAAQISQMIKTEKMLNTESQGGYVPGYELPKMHKNISSSMFFC
ncbi:hypothetical protein RD792_004794 [Penstemon davidsonii]|uniref:Argonaute 4 n=1 Tax=Penstemon davidsonii TaxID=160366 RepID=A0ABR0DID4_9LAMI|nr:hypothetical protein RD792_004794 [Penstemon davidsonii]